MRGKRLGAEHAAPELRTISPGAQPKQGCSNGALQRLSSGKRYGTSTLNTYRREQFDFL